MPVKPESGTKQKILEAAKKLFSERGYNGVSVRDISAEADVNVGAVSYYFGGKENLYQEVIGSGFDEVRQAVTGILNEDAPPRERLELVFEEFLEFLLKEDSVSRIVFSELALGGGKLPESVERNFTRVFASIHSIISEAVDKGEFRRADPTLMIISFASFPAYLFFARPIVESIRGEKGYTKAFIKKAARHHVDVLLNGLGGKMLNK